MTVEVTLTRDELIHAAQGGATRQIDALLNRRGSHFEHIDSWQHHVCGAMAEMAVAKYSGKFWFPCYDDPLAIPADVGRVQVRSAQRSTDSLILRDKDDPAQAYILVTYDVPRFTLRGWLWGHEGQREEFKRPSEGDKPRAWFVPQARLRPMG